jgi:phosphate transport system substrate-binding protein
MQLDTIGGYHVIARLGRGGMADVFLAVRTGLVGFSKLSVIKRLRPDLLDDPQAERYRTLLLDEARIAARLRHPNIVPTFEVGEHDGQPFLAMEYLEGQPVSQVLMRAQRLGLEIPVELSLQVVAHTLAALDYAHQLTDYDGSPLCLVHRDVSPQNIFWTYAGEVKLVDFGVAKFRFGQDETQTGMLKGKLGYMAPEQARCEEIDGRADVFAAGVVLWELLTGRRMLGAKTQAGQLRQLLFELLPPLHAVKPDIDSRIARICDRALERDPARRYASAAAMRDDIEHVLGARRPRRDELAAFIAPLFAPDRQQVTEQIKSAMAGNRTSASALITLPRAEPSSSYLELEVTPQPQTVVARTTAPVLKRPRRKLAYIAAALAASAAVTIGAIALFWSNPRGTASAAVVPGPQPAATPLLVEPALRLCGSNTVGAELGPAIVEAFLKKRGATGIARTAAAEKHVRITGTLDGAPIAFDLRAAGTATAFEGLTAKTCDVGMASRAINTDEVATTERAGLGDLRSPATEHVLALDGIAVIVHRNNPLRTLDRATLRAVFTGEITDWAQLGAPAGPIHVLARDHNSGTFDTFKALVLGKAELRAGTPRYEDSVALADAVAADPDAIGFIGLPYIRATKALAIGDAGAPAMLPTSFTITTEGYLLARRLYLYVPAQSRSPLATDLVSFALSAAGQDVVREVGFVDLDVVAGEGIVCDARCPKRYAELVARGHRLSVDFRFRYGRDEPDSRATRDLDRLVGYLARHPGSQVMLLGFSDSSGDAAYNVKLSQSRATSIARELATRGVHAAAVDGFGAAMPVSANATEPDRERNRRVEVWVRGE